MGKNLWEIDDIGIFFPVNVVLAHDLMMYNKLYRKHPETGEVMGGYMEPDRRVRFIKMKGVSSRGLFLPLTSLDYLSKSVHDYTKSLKVGMSFDSLDGVVICERYVTAIAEQPQKNQKVGKAKSRRFKNFYEIGDTSKLTANVARFEKDVWILTEKLHGTSARTGFLELEQEKNWLDKVLSKFGFERKKVFGHISGTRRTVIGENDSLNGKEDYRQYYHRFFKERLKPGQIVYYEIVGPGVMPKHDIQTKSDIQKLYPGNVISYSYGLENGDYEAYVYKIVDHTSDGRVIVYSWDQLVEWCNQHEVKHVPVVSTIFYQPELRKEIMTNIGYYADGPSELDARHPREGVVVKNSKGDFKFKGDTFCTLEEIMLNSNQYVDPEDTV